MRRSKIVFHPLFVLACSAAAIWAYVWFMRWRHPGGDLSNNFQYVLPIIVPFIAFIFDRAKQSPAALLESIVDAAVVITSIMRMIGDVPLVSGHALFLTYAIMRPGSRLTKITAGIVMLQVIYLKYFVWHDLITPTAGVTLGLLAALVVGRARRNPGRLAPLPSNQ
jgi:uncharacterized membrane protein